MVVFFSFVLLVMSGMPTIVVPTFPVGACSSQFHGVNFPSVFPPSFAALLTNWPWPHTYTS